MKLKLIAFLLIGLVTKINAQESIWNSLLETHVSEKGIVDYKGFQAEQTKLNSYLEYLQTTTPNSTWSANKKKAFWMNAYNAYTVKLILDNYPLKSITKIRIKGKDAWNTPFANVGGKIYTLNAIEHEILRKIYKDPRIHVGVNCASFSCPPLANFAFTEQNVEASLEKLMKQFINDSNRNTLTSEKIYLSKIFDWYKGDFTQNQKLVEYINNYTDIELTKKTKVRYLEYNWSLNE